MMSTFAATSLSIVALALLQQAAATAEIPADNAEVMEEAVGEAEASDDSGEEDTEFGRMLGLLMSGQSQIQGDDYDAALAAAEQHPLGTEENPVRANMPGGQRAYLNTLRCPDGAPPHYRRQGSGGNSPYGNIIDYYTVSCDGAEPVTIIMDMYHRGNVETRPVPGFTVAD